MAHRRKEPVAEIPGTGGSEDPTTALSKLAKLLQQRVSELEHENETLRAENVSLNAENSNMKASLDADPKPEASEAGLTDEALRKRLERVCKRNRQGRLGCVHGWLSVRL